MENKNNVKIRIENIQSDEDDEIMETFLQTEGVLTEKRDKKYLMYKEVDEKTGAVTNNRLIIEQTQIVLKKSGDIISEMNFKTGMKSAALYKTPYGSIPLNVTTNKMQWEEMQKEIKVYLEYLLEMQGTVLTCKMKIYIEKYNV